MCLRRGGSLGPRAGAPAVHAMRPKAGTEMKQPASVEGVYGLVHSHHSKLLRTRASSSPDVPCVPETRPRSFTGPLRPPRQMSLSEVEDGWVRMDRATYQYACQDVLNFKTNLLKLKRILQEADTLNPFDVNAKNGLYWNLATVDLPGANLEEGEREKKEKAATEEKADTRQQKAASDELSDQPPDKWTSTEADLRRQVVFLQQELEERDRTIRLLQTQMMKYMSVSSAADREDREMCNAAVQTERLRPLSAGAVISHAASVSDGLGPTVSSPEQHGAEEGNRWDSVRPLAKSRSCHMTKGKTVLAGGELAADMAAPVVSSIPRRQREPARAVTRRSLSTGRL